MNIVTTPSKYLAIAIAALLLTGCASHPITSDWRSCAVAGAVGSAGLAASGDSNDEVGAAVGGAILGGAICAIFGGDQDSDGDGVVDGDDQCPNTPSGVKVDRNGCPTDMDGDGVADYLDACQGTPRGTKVDARGCALDSDGDGVVDSKDQCPNTPRGAKVDGKGCALVTTLNGVHFEFDSAALTGKAKDVLDQAAATVKSSSGSVMVVGHTDDLGDAGYNQQLSEARAQATVSYLISQGVTASRLSAKGMGEAEPVADNATKAGRAMNRRVELRFMK